MSCLLAYLFFIFWFCCWSSKTNRSLSKISIGFLFSFALYSAVFVGIKQVVIKIYLKNTTIHSAKVFDTVFYYLQIYKVKEFKLISTRLNKLTKNHELCHLNYPVHVWSDFYKH